MKLKVRAALFQCGRCRKRYANPFGHVCVTRLDRRAPAGRTTAAPKLGLSTGTCTTCKKPLGNPLTHTCTTRTDYKKRTAKAKKDAAAASRKSRPQHPPWAACKDTDCQRTGCRAYRDGHEDGYRDGYRDGHEEGYRAGHHDGYRAGRQDGYRDGFQDGRASCPRKHA